MGLLEVRGFGVGCEENSKAGVDYTSLNLVSICEHFFRWPQNKLRRPVHWGKLQIDNGRWKQFQRPFRFGRRPDPLVFADLKYSHISRQG